MDKTEFKRLLKSAKSGNVEAQYLVGTTYANKYSAITGISDTEKSWEKAEYWLDKAISNGYRFSDRESEHTYYILAKLYKYRYQKIDIAAQYYEKAYLYGAAADLYAQGDSNLKQNPDKAMALYAREIEYQDSLLLHNKYRKDPYLLNRALQQRDKYIEKFIVYQQSIGGMTEMECRQKYATPALSLQTVPDSHQPSVQNTYTAEVCYQKGEAYLQTQPADYQHAAEWFEKAANMKYRKAYYQLGNCYSLDDSPLKDAQKAHYWYGLGIGHGPEEGNEFYHQCCWMIGLDFEFGKGVDKNYDSALYFYQQFRKSTLPQNYSTADKAIARVIQKQRQLASNHTPSSTANTSGKNSSISSSHPKIDLPSYGTIPNNIDYYYSDNKKTQAIHVFGNKGTGQFSNAISLSVFSWVGTLFYSLNTPQDLGDKFKFNTSYNLGYTTTEQQLFISKDWQKVTLNNGLVFDIPITKEEYEKINTLPKKLQQTHNSGGTILPEDEGSNENHSNQNQKSRYGTRTCPTCFGNKKCPTCGGKHLYNNPYTGEQIICPNCGPEGKCSKCNGTGQVYGIK